MEEIEGRQVVDFRLPEVPRLPAQDRALIGLGAIALGIPVAAAALLGARFGLGQLRALHQLTTLEKWGAASGGALLGEAATAVVAAYILNRTVETRKLSGPRRKWADAIMQAHAPVGMGVTSENVEQVVNPLRRAVDQMGTGKSWDAARRRIATTLAHCEAMQLIWTFENKPSKGKTRLQLIAEKRAALRKANLSQNEEVWSKLKDIEYLADVQILLDKTRSMPSTNALKHLKAYENKLIKKNDQFAREVLGMVRGEIANRQNPVQHPEDRADEADFDQEWKDWLKDGLSGDWKNFSGSAVSAEIEKKLEEEMQYVKGQLSAPPLARMLGEWQVAVRDAGEIINDDSLSLQEKKEKLEKLLAESEVESLRAKCLIREKG